MINKKVPIKELYGVFRYNEWINEVKNSYDFDWLRKNLKEKGLLEPLVCFELKESKLSTIKKFKYQISNGNHRAYILKELYGEDYEIKICIVSEEQGESLALNRLRRISQTKYE